MKMKDAFLIQTIKGQMDVDYQDYRPVAVYINGEYWGIYFIREKVDETFVSNHYNVQTSDTDTSILRIDGEVKTGTDKEYNALIKYITNVFMFKCKIGSE